MGRFCCEVFDRAVTVAGTDRENYEAAIQWDVERGGWDISDQLAPLRFCPWCGNALSAPPAGHETPAP